MSLMTTRGLAVSLGLILALMASGCSETGFGESVSLPKDKHASLLDDFAAGAPLRLPADAAFNVADSQRQATGAGQADSAADAAGTAHCTASADGAGTATAEFQLGHVLDNRGDQPLNVTARFDVDYECSLESPPDTASDATAKPADQLGVRVFVRDSNRHIHRTMMLTDISQYTGPKQWSGRQSPAFDVTLEPGLAYYFVLAGRATVSGTETTTASAKINVRSMNVELTPRK